MAVVFYTEEYSQTLHTLEFLSWYCILMHFVAIVILFSYSLLFCSKVISEINKELEVCRDTEWCKKNTLKSLFFVHKEKKPPKTATDSFKNENLKILFQGFDKLCGYCESLNENFNLSLTCVCVFNLCQLVVTLYDLFNFENSRTFYLLPWFTYVGVTQWILLYSCESFQWETRKTGVLVNQICTDVSSQSLKDTVQRFSMHLLHRKVEFTACGLFNLDYKLLYTVASSIITYLVIVFQFEHDMAEQAKYNSTT